MPKATLPGSFWWIILSLIPVLFMFKILVSSWKQKTKPVFLCVGDSSLKLISENYKDGSFTKEVSYSCKCYVMTTYNRFIIQFYDDSHIFSSIALNTWTEVKEFIRLTKFSVLSTCKKVGTGSLKLKEVRCSSFLKLEARPFFISLIPLIWCCFILFGYGGGLGFYFMTAIANVSDERPALYEMCKKGSIYFPPGASVNAIGATAALELGEYEDAIAFAERVSFLGRGVGEMGKFEARFKETLLFCKKTIPLKEKVFSKTVPEGIDERVFYEFQYGLELFELMSSFTKETQIDGVITKKSLTETYPSIYLPILDQYKKSWELSEKTYVPAAVEYIKASAGFAPYKLWDKSYFIIAERRYNQAESVMDELLSASPEFNESPLYAQVLLLNHKLDKASKILASSNKFEDKLLLLSLSRFTPSDESEKGLNEGEPELNDSEKRFNGYEHVLSDSKKRKAKEDIALLLKNYPEKRDEIELLEALVLHNVKKDDANFQKENLKLLPLADEESLDCSTNTTLPATTNSATPATTISTTPATTICTTPASTISTTPASTISTTPPTIERGIRLLSHIFANNEIVEVPMDTVNSDKSKPEVKIYSSLHYPDFVLPVDIAVFRCLEEYTKYNKEIAAKEDYLENYNEYRNEKDFDATDIDGFIQKKMKSITYLCNLDIGQHSALAKKCRAKLEKALEDQEEH